MRVTKRNGNMESVRFDTITDRLRPLCEGLDTRVVDPVYIAQKVVSTIYDGISTAELDNHAAEIAVQHLSTHPDFGKLATRIVVTNLWKSTPASFSAAVRVLAPQLSPDFLAFVETHHAALDAAIDNSRDTTNLHFFGFKTLERSYLLRAKGADRAIVERPQYMYMRVAVAIHGDFRDPKTLENVLDAYHLMGAGYYTHASPTLYHAGLCKENASLASCYLMDMREDSIEGIFETLKDCALISRGAGGIGLSIHDVRATGAPIDGTNGTSNGIVPMLGVYNATARYVDQGGGRRKGAIAVYVEPWHLDIFAFLDLRKNTGKDEIRARDLFLGLWASDLFMERVNTDGQWTLFSPDAVRDLPELHGDAFRAAYETYELRFDSGDPAMQQRGKRIRARDLWKHYVDALIETGTPYLLFKDRCNALSNHKHLGTIRSSNLCTEIVQYTKRGEQVAVCNLASIALPKFVYAGQGDWGFDHHRLAKTVRVIVRSLDNVITRSAYPIPEARTSNMLHRPMGIGVQGLADVFMRFRMSFDSPEAAELNREIFETIYFAALDASCTLAQERGRFPSYEGSPISQGLLQMDLWEKYRCTKQSPTKLSGRHDWDGLRARIAEHGVRNSLLVAPMPTASTSQILGNNECFEPYTSNIYSRRVLSGEFTCVNEHLVRELLAMGRWSVELKDKIIAAGGSVQNIPEIPEYIKPKYKTVWEISQKVVIDMAAARGPFVDQSQSMNLFLKEANYQNVTSMLLYAWEKGLKTGAYYLRTQGAANPIMFTIDVKTQKQAEASSSSSSSFSKAAAAKEEEEEVVVCTRAMREAGCESCSA